MSERPTETVGRCRVVGYDKPNVWHDGDQWQADQTTRCLTCGNINLCRFADDGATWDEAMVAATDALPIRPGLRT